MIRGHSIFTVKAFDEDSRTVAGIATTPRPDRMGDIVESKGAKFKLPLPLLWQHDSRAPVGHVTDAKVSDSGITVTARVAKVDEPGTVKDRLDEAWQSVKAGLVRGFSIGFRVLNNATEPIKGGGLRFLETEILEISLVTIPANSEATITAIKAADNRLRSALPVVRLRRPGAVYLER